MATQFKLGREVEIIIKQTDKRRKPLKLTILATKVDVERVLEDIDIEQNCSRGKVFTGIYNIKIRGTRI